MKNKLPIILVMVLMLLCGCAKTDVKNAEEYKKELTGKYPPYEFKGAALVYLRYPTLEELIKRAESGVSFIVSNEVTPLEPVSFKYENTEADTGTLAIEEKTIEQGISPAAEIMLFPYEAEVRGTYGNKGAKGKTVFFITQYFSKVPDIEGAMGILVSAGEDVPSAWITAYEKAYPAADSYVCLLHPELSYYYISEDGTVIPMCRHNEEEYDLLTGLAIKEFEKMLN